MATSFETSAASSSFSNPASASETESVKQTGSKANVRDAECLSCRITGTGIMAGTGAYAVWQSRAAAPGTLMQKRIVAGLGIGLMIGSVFRWRSWKW
ncbi:hypothetical protein CPB83DRAFT_854302 [Crepidotus variabilis]|uniref:Distal membrane-arm assembly complex protein 1-like domain-containing protein n=1 Tax=Crepidotus variabilis TaxID=179855 RepID=A0A9P6EGH8_9AGAR|nr:hypothetical protein CPB83DRAFT_854302 [Crepidotus variabilis]